MTGHTYLKLHLLNVMTFCIVSGAQKYINFWTFLQLTVYLMMKFETQQMNRKNLNYDNQ